MTDITRKKTSYQAEDRSWLRGLHGSEMTRPCTLDVSVFTQADHYPDGFIPSGILLEKAGSVYVPWDSATGTCAGILFGSLKIPNLLDLTVNPAGALLVHGFVNISRLPIAAGVDGSYHVNAVADLPMIYFD